MRSGLEVLVSVLPELPPRDPVGCSESFPEEAEGPEEYRRHFHPGCLNSPCLSVVLTVLAVLVTVPLILIRIRLCVLSVLSVVHFRMEMGIHVVLGY